MKIIVNKHDIEIIKNEIINEKEVNVNEIVYEFSTDYNVSGINKKAIFTNDTTGKSVEIAIIDNKSIIPIEAVEENGSCLIGVYAYTVTSDNKINFRLNPSPKHVQIENGSMKTADNTTPPTPSRYEQYVQALNEKLEQLESDIEDFQDTAEEVEAQGDYAKAQGDKAKDLVDNFSGTIAEIRASIPTKVSDLPNDSCYINKNVNDLSNYYLKSDTYNKTEIDEKLAKVLTYKGSVATYNDLPSTKNQIGDTYNVNDTGKNYAWNGTEWDDLGGVVDLSSYYTKSETDNLLNQKVDTNTLNSYYTSSQVDTKLSGKVNNSTYESKVQEIETSLDSKLEASDLNDYVKNTDYASDSKSGVVKLNLSKTGLKLNSNNELEPTVLTSGQAYQGVNDEFVMSKRTFEIAVGGKGYATSSYVDEKIGDIESVIDLINGETLSTTSLLNEEVE